MFHLEDCKEKMHRSHQWQDGEVCSEMPKIQENQVDWMDCIRCCCCGEAKRRRGLETDHEVGNAEGKDSEKNPTKVCLQEMGGERQEIVYVSPFCSILFQGSKDMAQRLAKKGERETGTCCVEGKSMLDYETWVIHDRRGHFSEQHL